MSSALPWGKKSKKTSAKRGSEVTERKPGVTQHEFLVQLKKYPHGSVRELLAEFLQEEKDLRVQYARSHQPFVLQENLISVFENGNADLLKIRARKPDTFDQNKYILPLKDVVDVGGNRKLKYWGPMHKFSGRKKDKSHILVKDLVVFKSNFRSFTCGMLQYLDWNNVIAAGSSVLISMLDIADEHTLATHYEDIAPQSDIDLFIYGIHDRKAAIDKMIQIESAIKQICHSETVTVRTRNTVTICSKSPFRHVQIILRLYRSPCEVLTGFDVDCCCFAYDGTNVFSNPRGLAACITQCNNLDLTRRSPSYEMRLFKYRQLGFEVYWEGLDRSQVQDRIFHTPTPGKLQGLAKLLYLENKYGKYSPLEDCIQSNYSTMKIPYGHMVDAQYISKAFTDASWWLNDVDSRGSHGGLHRHPGFVGSDVISLVGDPCGNCPTPEGPELEKLQEDCDKYYVRGDLKFLYDDPGRQEIGSFFPLTSADYTDMAYKPLWYEGLGIGEIKDTSEIKNTSEICNTSEM